MSKKSRAAFSPGQLHQFGMYLEGNWYRLECRENSFPHDPIGILDVSILQENILSPLLGIQDPRTDNRIDFVGGIRGLKELEKSVDSGQMKLHSVFIRLAWTNFLILLTAGRSCLRNLPGLNLNYVTDF